MLKLYLRSTLTLTPIVLHKYLNYYISTWHVISVPMSIFSAPSYGEREWNRRVTGMLIINKSEKHVLEQGHLFPLCNFFSFNISKFF